MTKQNTKLDNDFKEMNQNINLTCPILSSKVFWESFEKWSAKYTTSSN